MWKMLLTSALAVAFFSPAYGQLPQDPTAADFMAASDAVKGAYLLAVAERINPEASKGEAVILATRIGACIAEATTVRNRQEAPAALLMRSQPLADLAALCVLMDRRSR